MTCSYCRSTRLAGVNCPNCGAALTEPEPGMGLFELGSFVVPQNPIQPFAGGSLAELLTRGVQ